MTGYGECAACGSPLNDGEMFHGELCEACDAEWKRDWQAACPAASDEGATARGMKRRDEHTIRTRNRHFGVLGPFSSSLTLAWLATHRDRLSTLLLGGKRLSVLVVWDRRGSALVDHSDAEVNALRTIVYGDDERVQKNQQEVNDGSA